MYVCICKAVTDGDIQRAAHQGARNLRDLQESLGVASSCGKCAQCARVVLREAVQVCEERKTAGVPASPWYVPGPFPFNSNAA